MSYKIVVDSCCELPEEYKKDSRFEIVPLGLEVGDYQILDDENFDQKDFIKRIAECPECPKSSCPSPLRFMEAYDAPVDHVYVVTLSAKLSGSYNSAVLGKNMYMEQKNDKKIHVVDSQSACCGETQIAFKAMELEEQGLPFEEIVERLEKYRDEMETFFVLDNLETLQKNGRLTGLKAVVAAKLSIKPVMGAIEGMIVEKAKCIGMKKALKQLVDIAVKTIKNPEQKRIMITNCNCPERAEEVKKMLLEHGPFGEVIILPAAGVSTMYANDGGIVVTG